MRWRSASGNRRSAPGSCCACTGKPIECSGAWSDAAVDYAMLNGSLHTVFGWRVQVPPISNPRSLS